jgi:hypothetical protein
MPDIFIRYQKIKIMEDNQPSQPERVPFFQMIMDDFMLLLFLGVTIYSVFYLLWGVMELSNLPSIPESIKQDLLK